MLAPYPNNTAERTAWIATQRGPRYSVDARRPNGFFVEDEVTDGGKIVSVATIFLTNRECPWRCVMCDLWQRTLIESVPEGAIPEQINFSLAQLPPTSVVKLYNSGSFFDGAAIPAVDHGRIAAQLTDFERVIVESHPAFVGSAARRFEEQLQGMLEVAMGLETVHPQILS